MLELIFQGFFEWIYGMILECWEYFASALLDVMSLDFAYLKSHIPVIGDMMQVLLAVGWALLIGNLVFQAIRSMLSGLGFEGEDPKILFARTFVFAFLLLASPQICEIGLNLTSNIMELLEVPDAVNVQLVDDSAFGSLTAAWLLVIICDVILMFKILKLIVEIAERYIILALLTITAPLAFSTGGSRSTSDIFTGWCRMYGSMCLLMVTHVIFFKMLLSVVSAVPSGIDVFAWMVLVFGIVKAAKKADAIITRIGLNPALTGGGGRSLPGMLTYAVVKGAASGVSKTLGKSLGGGSRGAAGGWTPPGGGGPRAGGPSGSGKGSSRFWGSGKKNSGSNSTYTGNKATYTKQSSPTGSQTSEQRRPTATEQTDTAQHQQAGPSSAGSPAAPTTAQASDDLPHASTGKGVQTRPGEPHPDRKTSIPKGVQRGVSHVRATTTLSNDAKQEKPLESSAGRPTASGATPKVAAVTATPSAGGPSQTADTRFTQTPARQESAGAEAHTQPQNAVRVSQPLQKDEGKAKMGRAAAEAGQDGQFRSSRRQITPGGAHSGPDAPTRGQPGTAGTGGVPFGEASAQPFQHGRQGVPSSEGSPTLSKSFSPATQEAGVSPSKTGAEKMRGVSGTVQQEGHLPPPTSAPPIQGTAYPGTAGTGVKSKVTGQQPSAAKRSSAGGPGASKADRHQLKQTGLSATATPKGQPTRRTTPRPPDLKGGTESGR